MIKTVKITDVTVIDFKKDAETGLMELDDKGAPISELKVITITGDNWEKELKKKVGAKEFVKLQIVKAESQPLKTYFLDDEEFFKHAKELTEEEARKYTKVPKAKDETKATEKTAK